MPNIQLFKSYLDKKDFQVMRKSIESGWLTHGENNLIFEKILLDIRKVNMQFL